MVQKIIIRFRDLTVELGGTITDHRIILRNFGEVWWGWFMQPYETVPRNLFGELLDRIKTNGPIESFLFDTGQGLIYSCLISDIKVAPTARGILSPNPKQSPEYYHRGRYSAWFQLRGISDTKFEDLGLFYSSFPTRPELQGTLGQLVGRRVESPQQLRETKVTLWSVDSDTN